MTSATANPVLRALPAAYVLVPTDQIARRPLVPWAADLRREAAAAANAGGSTYDRVRCEELIRCGNAAALVLANGGRADAALRICEAEIVWVRRLAERYRRPGLRPLVVQPWINIGRLHARGGRVEEARRHFDQVGRCSPARPCPIADLVIQPDDWTEQDRDLDALREFCRTVLVVDTLRALLANRRFEDVLAFAAERPADGVDHLEPIVAEAELVALGRLQRLDEALARVDGYARRADSWERIVIRLREAELLVAAGVEDRARRVIARLIDVCSRVDLAAKARVPFLLPIEHLLRIAWSLDLADEALSLAEAAYKAAQRLEDEPLQAGLLRLLAEAPGNPVRRAEFAAALDRLIETTAYARLRGGDGSAAPKAAPDTAVLDALFAELLAILDT